MPVFLFSLPFVAVCIVLPGIFTKFQRSCVAYAHMMLINKNNNTNAAKSNYQTQQKTQDSSQSHAHEYIVVFDYFEAVSVHHVLT